MSSSPKAKKALVVHSGGMDSSLTLAIAAKEHPKEDLLSISFLYGQRHSNEVSHAAAICRDWGIDHVIIDLPFYPKITTSALIGTTLPITPKTSSTPASTIVIGRNGLMAQIAAIYAHSLGAATLYMGLIEDDALLAGYRDCSRQYVDLIEAALRLDLANPSFQILTPLITKTKPQVFQLASDMGLFDYLREHTLSCYQGIPHPGCGTCPTCLRGSAP